MTRRLGPVLGFLLLLACGKNDPAPATQADATSNSAETGTGVAAQPSRCQQTWEHVAELKKRRKAMQTTGWILGTLGAGTVVTSSSVLVAGAAAPVDNSGTTAVSAGVITAGVGVAAVGVILLAEADRAYRDQLAMERRGYAACEEERAAGQAQAGEGKGAEPEVDEEDAPSESPQDPPTVENTATPAAPAASTGTQGASAHTDAVEANVAGGASAPSAKPAVPLKSK